MAKGDQNAAIGAARLRRGAPSEPSAPWPDEVLLAILDHVPAPITWWDSSLRLRFANAAAVELFAASDRAELVGRRWLELVPTSWKQACRECIATALDGHACSMERRIPSRSGSSRHVQITFTPYAPNGQMNGFCAVMHDVTHRATTESVLRRHAEELAASAASWQHRANTDPLTGLVNRQHLAQLVNDTMEEPGTRALMLIDLDGFKEVNDLFGHAAGDEVLVEVAERLRSHVRAPDIVARLGGDEFVVFLANLANPGDGEAMAQRMIDTLNVPIPVLNGASMVSVRASIGVAVDSRARDRVRFSGLLASADSLMYEAKQHGNQWRSNRQARP